MEAVSTEAFKKKAVGPLKNFQYDGSANLREFFDANLVAYYQNLNLDSDGIPKAETLTKYGLLPPDQATSWYEKIVAQQKPLGQTNHEALEAANHD
jgi:hypothetical protein